MIRSQASSLLRWAMLMGITAWTAAAVAQNPHNPSQPPSPPTSLNDSIRDLQQQVRDLQAAVAGMRDDWRRARAETAELRRELDEVRAPVEPHPVLLTNAVLTPASHPSLANSLQDEKTPPKSEQKNSDHAASIEEEYQLLSGKVDDQYQTKVESASKYRVRLSGIVLMNLFSNQGVVDNIDLPTLAFARPPGDSGGSFGATLRQSEIGFEAFGPTVAGAKTKADLQLDLGGGFASVPNGVNSGLVRLRTATMRMDWANTSVVVGQDPIFFSPNSPTSFATLAIPALSSAGNLWGWIPQLRVEHKLSLSEDSNLLFQAGILDPVTGETPYAAYDRLAGPGEASRQPAYASRIAWTRTIDGQPLRLGVAGYYSRQDYNFNRNVDGWAAMTDLDLPLTHQFSLSGEFYRGRALGGLYGGVGRSVLFSGDPTLSSTQIQALNSIGGWAQLKYHPAIKWEFNAAFGIDNPYASDLKYFPYAENYGNQALARNLGSLVNTIYRPRSDLLFSAEYRHLTTYSLVNGGNGAGQLNLMMGVLF
ncbi:MAG: hypothetical protein ACLQFM_09895 [Terriglobales bacterium]|jgi:hypothetical protein